MRKVLLVTNIPTPYRIPLFNTLSSGLREAGWHLKVAFAAPTYARRKWRVDPDSFRFDHAMLGTGSRSIRRRKPLFFYSGLLGLLRTEKPDVVVSAGFSIGTFKSWLWTRLTGAPLLIWSGSVQEHRGFLRRAYRSFLARQAAGAVCYGSQARDYIIELGMRKDRTQLALNTVDVGFFRSRAADDVKESPRRFVCVGDLIRRKRVDLLLHAVKELSLRRDDFVLELIGDGPLEGELRRLADELGISRLVRFEGFQPNDEVPRYLAAASGFAFPTGKDIWGLVLIEAMAAGLPCVASVRAGATTDVIEHGVNGFAADFEDAATVADHLEWILDRPREAAEMGRRASRFVSEELSLEASAQGFVDAISGIGHLSDVRTRETWSGYETREALYDVS